MSIVEKNITVELTSAEDTKSLGWILCGLLEPGTVISLSGDLGSGKSTFVSGITKRLNSPSYAASPTYNILHIHDTTPPLYHFDVYRLKDSLEFEEIGGEEYFYGDGIAVVEWAEKIERFLPLERIHITMEHCELGRQANIVFPPCFSEKLQTFFSQLEKLAISCRM